MKLHIIQNGNIKLLITPDTEIEKLQLNQLFQGEVDVQFHEKLQLIDKALVDSFLISPKAKSE